MVYEADVGGGAQIGQMAEDLPSAGFRERAGGNG
jgi:hypothetical protein